LCFFNSDGKGFGFFRVRGFYRWKTPIGLGLFLYNGDIVITCALQYFRDRGNGSAMKGGEYDLKIFLSLSAKIPIFNGGIYKSFIDLSVDQFYQSFIGPKL